MKNVFKTLEKIFFSINKLISTNIPKIKAINYIFFISIIIVLAYGLKRYSDHVEAKREIFYENLYSHKEYFQIKNYWICTCQLIRFEVSFGHENAIVDFG